MDKPALIILLNRSDENSIVFMRSVIETFETNILIIDTRSDKDGYLPVLDMENYGDKVHGIHATKSKAPLAGMSYYAKHIQKNASGAILVDMDQGFNLQDIQIVVDAMENIPETIIIGGREDKEVFRKSSSFFISQLSKLSGVRIEDINSGLRGLPASFVNYLIEQNTNKSNFWLEMYIQAGKSQTQLIEVPIHSPNKSKSPILINFLINSSKLIYIFLRFSFLSMVTAGIDYAVFSVILLFSHSIFFSILIARIVAGSFQFFMGKKWVFKSKSKFISELLKYILLVGLLMLVSYSFIELMVTNFGMNAIISKMIAELSLFLISFIVQKKIIFNQSTVSKN